MTDRPYTPERLAERWDCTANYVRALVRDGKLPAFYIGKFIRIPAAVPVAWLRGGCRAYSYRPGGQPPGVGGTPPHAEARAYTAPYLRQNSKPLHVFSLSRC